MDGENHLDTGRTAADEAKDAENQKRPTVTVTCALAQGIVLNNHLGRDGKPSMAANMGPVGPIEVRGSAEGVDKAFWDAWAANNKDLVDRGIVSAIPTEEIQQNERERQDGENMGREGSDDPEQDL